MTGHDPLEALLKATGRRPSVSTARSLRVHDAVHAAWRSEIARRTRGRRILGGAALLAAAVVIAIAGWRLRNGTPTVPEIPAMRVERIAGSAWTQDGAILRTGFSVAGGSIVKTAADGRVALAASTGHSVRLDGDTTLHLASDRAYVLERGAVYVESAATHSRTTEAITVTTPLGKVEELGTQFEARLASGALRVRVREGRVWVATVAGARLVQAGEAVSADGSGRIDPAERGDNAAGWAWAEDIAPAMEIDGRSLMAFIEWVARERGMTVRFENPGLETRARSIVLHGSVAGMTPDEAALSVLATSGLSSRRENDVLVVFEEAPAVPAR